MIQSRCTVNIGQLNEELKNHPNRSYVTYLINGFTNGFDTGFTRLPELSFECKNLLSARRYPISTSELIQSELNKGFLIGPSSKKRLIVDMSAPHENEHHPSLNELINKEDYSLSYVTIDNAISLIKKVGKGAWLCKTDLQDAFKQCPLSDKVIPYHGIKWDNKYYFYTRLVFGSRSAPKIFDSISMAVCWILENNYNIEYILHLLDDFLTIDRPDSTPERTMAILTLVFRKLGLPLSQKKTVGPTHVLEYLGIILDSIRMEARLPTEKVSRITEFIEEFLKRKSCTKREL